MDYKRLLIALVLSAGVLLIWPKIFPPPPTAPKPPVPTAGPAATAGAAGAAGAVPTTAGAGAKGAAPGVAAGASAATLPSAPPVPAGPPIGATEEKLERVETPLYVAEVSNRGGALVSFALKKYDDATRKPLDLVRQTPPFPKRTLVLDPADPFLARAAQALFVAERAESGGETTLRLRYRDETGAGITRSWKFGRSYVVSAKVEREGTAAPAPVGLVLGPGIGNPSAEELANTYTKPGSTLVLEPGGGVKRYEKDSLKEPVAAPVGATAAGLEDNYFLTAFLLGKVGTTVLRPVTFQLPAEAGKEAPAPLVESEIVLSGAGSLEAEVFLGPKELGVLQHLCPGAEGLIDYGWFAILAKPLLAVLKWIQGGVGNWGVAIILITILIKIVLFPLTYKQLVSMKKMSLLQPKMDAIKLRWSDKVKKDPEARVKMNEEVMGLYKQEGVNPAGGCLPLLLQMPILFAFYQMLAKAIELRHAPFWLWIQDLSAKDPYYVTPILMTATMFIQQQMTPATGDATQRKILGAMPLVFGFMFKDVPSGLVLYWLVQNVLTIGQQMLLDRFTDLGPAKGAGKKKGKG